MVAPSTWESSQAAVQARTAPAAASSGRGRCLTMPAGVSPALLGRPYPTGGSAGSLLQQMQRADPALYAHSWQVAGLAHQLTISLGWPGVEQSAITTAALLHDAGKLSLPRSLLDKPGRLSPQEYTLIQQHSAAGARLLQQLCVEEAIVALVYHHHERWDGLGYPEGLVGLAIPRGARLLAIADAFAVMTASRPYQPARSVSAALRELERGAGTQFDPWLVPQCVARLQATGEGTSRRICCSRCGCNCISPFPPMLRSRDPADVVSTSGT